MTTASELFAKANGKPCSGNEKCHWCVAPCEKINRHNESQGPAVRFGGISPVTSAKSPHSPWICNGCFMLRRSSVTVFYHGGGLDDRRCPLDHNWWLTETESLVLRKKDDSVYDLLLNPPERFALMLLTPAKNDKGADMPTNKEAHKPHLCPVNEGKVKADAELEYMLDNQVRSYSVRELEAALKQGNTTGKSGGVAMLISFFGKAERYREDPKPGRPKQTVESR